MGKFCTKGCYPANSPSFKHSRPFKSVICKTPSPPRCPELRSVLGNPLIPLLISSPPCFFSSATVNFTISPGRRAPKYGSWRSPWRRRGSPWIASGSSCAWPSGRSTCRSKRFFRTRWRKSWLLSGRKVFFLHCQHVRKLATFSFQFFAK